MLEVLSKDCPADWLWRGSSAPAAHGGPCWSKYSPTDHGGPHAGAGGFPKEVVTPCEACGGAGSWWDLLLCEERSPHWSRFAGETCDPLGDHAGAIFLTVSYGRDPCWSSSWRAAVHGMDPLCRRLCHCWDLRSEWEVRVVFISVLSEPSYRFRVAASDF